MKLRTDAKWNIASLTSMGVRITPLHRQAVHISDQYFMQATSAESNVLAVSGQLGMNALAMTSFVEGSPVAAFIKSQLRARGISFTGPEVPQGDAWGYRHQFNIADSGYGGRAPRVWNDRAGEVGRDMSIEDFDVEQIFDIEGVQVFHLSGLIAALSPNTSRLCVELAKRAKASGALVSLDMNYRASFWAGRETELRKAFLEIAEQCDILIGNEEDFQLALGIEGPPAGGSSVEEEIDGFKEMISRIQRQFGQAKVFATTLREVISANEHQWGMIVYGDGDYHVAMPRSISVHDRIGGGDGSVGGLLYGILQGWEIEKCMQFGWATGAMAAGNLYDYAAPVDEAQVWSVWEGNARVQR